MAHKPTAAATTRSVSSMEKRQAAIEITAYGIRENLMEYYKGNCAARTTRFGIDMVRLDNFVTRGRTYQYQRWLRNNEDTRVMFLQQTPILVCSHAPETLTYLKTLDRSADLREVKVHIEKFMDKFLTGVQKIQSTNNRFVDNSRQAVGMDTNPKKSDDRLLHAVALIPERNAEGVASSAANFTEVTEAILSRFDEMPQVDWQPIRMESSPRSVIDNRLTGYTVSANSGWGFVND